jgi:predicted transcriptional regulator
MDDYFFKVIFKRPQYNVETDNNDRIAIDSDRIAIENSDRISAILKYIEKSGSGKNSDFVKLLDVGPQRVRQILQSMIKSDLIEKHGDKRHTYYTLKNADEV